jgi:chromosome segregation ATPase
MGNEIKKALEKVAKLEARHQKMAGIFEKSKSKRAGTIAKLEMMAQKCRDKQVEIEAKEAKVMQDLAAQIAVAKQEEETLKTAINTVVAEQAAKSPEVQD